MKLYPILILALFVSLSACQSNESRLLDLKLEQAKLQLEHRDDCDAMATQLEAFFEDHAMDFERLHKVIERDRAARAKANDESQQTATYNADARKTLRDAHTARVRCMRSAAMIKLAQQRWELL